MNPITLHPSSLLVGVALAGLAFFTMAQTPQPINPSLTRPSSPSFIRAQDMVRITEGTPYVVPPNKWFVVTAMGCRPISGILGYQNYQYDGLLEFKVNGTVEMQSVILLSSPIIGMPGNAVTMNSVPRGLAVPAGSIIEVADTFPNSPSINASTRVGEAWGYLSDS